MEHEICVIEWPDKLGPLTPPEALRITFEPDTADPQCRHLTLDWSAPRWAEFLTHLQETADD